MLKLPSYVSVAVPVWLVLFIILVIVLPLNAWWEPFAPTQYAAFVLREASYIPLSRAGDNGCQYGEVRAWLWLRRHPAGRLWLRRVLEAGPAPADRILALAALTGTGDSELAPTQPESSTDSVRVLTDGWVWWTPADVREQLASGKLAEQFATAGPCPQWGLN